MPDDAGGVLVAMRNVLAEPDHNLNGTLDEFDISDAEERQFIEGITANANALMLVAEIVSTGQIVGTLTCQNTPRHAKRHVVRLGVTVCVGWRGKGIGTRLMQEAIRWAQRHNEIRRIELEVLARNTGAIALYSRLGFRVEGRGIEAVRKGDDYLDCYWMALPVAAKS